MYCDILNIVEQLSTSLKDTMIIASEILRSATKKQAVNMATVVALNGNLGSGKTTLTQYIATLVGVQEFITSPTFVLRKDYKTTKSNFSKLIHIDTYRMTNSNELETIGWSDVLHENNALVLVEWAEKVGITNSAIEVKCRTHKDKYFFEIIE